jgi:heme exporter protein D
MGDIGGYLAMGGYAGYVWPAYGLAVAVLGGLAVHSWRRYRASITALDRLQQGRGRRR